MDQTQILHFVHAQNKDLLLCNLLHGYLQESTPDHDQRSNEQDVLSPGPGLHEVKECKEDTGDEHMLVNQDASSPHSEAAQLVQHVDTLDIKGDCHVVSEENHL